VDGKRKQLQAGLDTFDVCSTFAITLFFAVMLRDKPTSSTTTQGFPLRHNSMEEKKILIVNESFRHAGKTKKKYPT
jgi:hypothetical protein